MNPDPMNGPSDQQQLLSPMAAGIRQTPAPLQDMQSVYPITSHPLPHTASHPISYAALTPLIPCGDIPPIWDPQGVRRSLPLALAAHLLKSGALQALRWAETDWVGNAQFRTEGG